MMNSYYRPPSKTIEGVKILFYAQIMGLFLTVISLTRTIFDFLGTTSTYSVSYMLSILMLVAYVILGIALLVAYIVGLHAMYKGRDEYGPEHNQQFTKGFWLIIIGFVVGIFFSPVGGALTAWGMVLLIIKLALPADVKKLWISFWSLLVVYGLVLIMVVMSIGVIFVAITSGNFDIAALMIPVLIVGILAVVISIVAYILRVQAYGNTLKHLQDNPPNPNINTGGQMPPPPPPWIPQGEPVEPRYLDDD